MNEKPFRTEGEPHSRLTRICDAMTTTLDEHPESGPDVKCMVFLNDKDRAGIVLHGYEDDVEAMADLLGHLKAIFEANGQQLLIAPMFRG